MKKLRIYVDTSVIGGCFDVEFAAWSNALIEDFRSGRFRLVLSDVTAAEVARAPVQVRDLHAELLSLAEILPVTEESLAPYMITSDTQAGSDGSGNWSDHYRMIARFRILSKTWIARRPAPFGARM